MEPLVDAFGYTNVRADGYEADDVIATLAKRAREQGIEVTIVTGDRDTFQLVGDGVKVMATGPRHHRHQDLRPRGRDRPLRDPAGVDTRLLRPKGDTSDNIPGVPGIGDKTAAQLLQQFGDLETVLNSVDEISGAKRKENLVNHADDARVSKQLATSIRDVPVEVDFDGSLAREPDRSRLRETFREFELRDPLRRLEEVFGEGDATAPARLPPTRPRPGPGQWSPAGADGAGERPRHAGGRAPRERRGPAAGPGGAAAAALRGLRGRRRAHGRVARGFGAAAGGLGRPAR